MTVEEEVLVRLVEVVLVLRLVLSCEVGYLVAIGMDWVEK